MLRKNIVSHSNYNKFLTVWTEIVNYPSMLCLNYKLYKNIRLPNIERVSMDNLLDQNYL